MEKINRKKIKKNAHVFFRKNFIMSILLVFIFSIIMTESYSYSTELVTESKKAVQVQKTVYNKETKKISFEKIDITSNKIAENIKGVLAPIVRRLGISTSPLYNLAYSVKLFFMEHNFNGGMFSLLITLLSILIYLFIKTILEIGKNRFFLESRIYHKTNVTKLLFPYRIKGTFRLTMILFVKRIYQILWSFTIVGGFIKLYEYSMIPYVLAENPAIERKEAFRLSKEMMYGYKWQSFILDLSLLGWNILGLITLGLSNILYFNAYREYVYAELYCELRNKKKKTLTDSKLLCDTYLYENKDKLDVYPTDKLTVPVKKININTDYNQTYKIRNLILLFFSGSFIGYSWEVFLHIVEDGKFVNRGTMFGPWLPIYGVGAVLILVILKPVRKRPFIFLLSAMALAGVLEYTTAWLLETFAHASWWNYTGYFLNIHGRVCFEGLLIFGLGGAAVTYFVAPVLNSLFNKINYKKAIILCTILLTLFGTDMIYSVKHPNTGKGISSQRIKK